METAAMGKVIVTARMENQGDLLDVTQGRRTADQVRSVEVTDALVDTGATLLGLPKRLITQLGLVPARTRSGRTVGGAVTVQIYNPVRLTIQGRDCLCEAMELADDLPVLVGQVPLELLDFVVDPANQRLVGNPDHGGQHMVDIL
jgi:predicted aspartyl protease